MTTNPVTALATVETSTAVTALIPTSIEGAMQLAKWLAAANFLPAIYQGKEANAFAMVLSGMELGLPPMAALRGLYPVNGKPSLESKTKAAICLNKGGAVYFKRTEYTPQATTWETKRRDTGEVSTMRYTFDQAKAAGLTTKAGPWSNYPQRMISHRALGWLCDDAYPDFMLGIGTAEDRFDGDVIDADFVDVPAPAGFASLPKIVDAPPKDPAAGAFEKARAMAKELEDRKRAEAEAAKDLSTVAGAIDASATETEPAPAPVPVSDADISEEWVAELTRDLFATTKKPKAEGLAELSAIGVKISKLKIAKADHENLTAAYKACRKTLEAKS